MPYGETGVKVNDRRKNLAGSLFTEADYGEVAESCEEQQHRWLRGDVA